MLSHYTIHTHRCDARCTLAVRSHDACTACETGNLSAYEHTCGQPAQRVPAWVERMRVQGLPGKDYTRA